MKKLSGLILALLAGIALWLVYGRKSAPPTPPPAGVASAQKEADQTPLVETLAKEPVEESTPTPAANARKPVPMLDTAGPVYQSALVLLENRFIRLLERETPAQSWPPEQLVDLANRLAKVRMALAMHEASIADYTMVENKAVIVIPAYPREGEAFQSQVQALLPPGFGSEEFRRQLLQRFGYYGRYGQQLEVGVGIQNIEGQPMKVFDIMHRVEMPFGMMGGSRLTDIYLGPYAPFIGAFPRG